MADKVIHVNVTATKSQKVNVSAGNVQNQITATADSSQYYSDLAKNWAISDKLINNEDYSAKKYANLAKQDAERANTFTNSCLETYNNVINYSAETIDNIVATKNSAISDISESGHKAVTDIETEKQNTITEIQDITINNKEEIEKLSNQEQNKIVSLGIESRANKDLSNLSAIGENKFNTILSNKITNCITEIPQKIKLELVGETFTIKAGSIVVFPDGTKDLSLNYTIGSTYKHSNLKVVDTKFTNGQFFVWAEVQNDVSLTSTGTATVTNNFMFIRATNGAFAWYGAATTYSGGTVPTAGQCWYDTTNNIINTSSDQFKTYANGALSLPICDFARVNGVVTEINQTFNGFGYIGSTVWVDKGVKYLVPNGRNADGTLNNIESITQNIITRTFSDTVSNCELALNLKDNSIGQHPKYELKDDNYLYYTSGSYAGQKLENIVVFATCDRTSGKISNFQPKLPFRAVDYNDFNSTPHIVETYVNGTSGYRVYSDGYCEQWGYSSAGNPVTVTFLKAFKDTNYAIYLGGTDPNPADGMASHCWTNKTTTSFGLWNRYGASATTSTCDWRACGYIA